MAERAGLERPLRADLLHALRAGLRQLEPPLEVIADQILGEVTRIDLVARDPSGRAVLVRLAEPGGDLAGVGDALAQCAWLKPRLADWLKLAPGLALDPEAGVRALLVAPHFDPRTLAAARALGPSVVQVATFRCFRNGGAVELVLEPAATTSEPRGADASPEGSRSRFRTGLVPEDLDLDEREPHGDRSDNFRLV